LEQIFYEVSLLWNNMTYIQNTYRFRGFKLTFADWVKFSLIEDWCLISRKILTNGALDVDAEELDGPSGQCARRAIAEAKHLSQWPVLGWVTKIYYLELLCASEGTLSRWSRLHLQSLSPTPVSRRVDVRQAAGRKNNCRIFITTRWKTCRTDPT
jgi:hypothetical protein